MAENIWPRKCTSCGEETQFNGMDEKLNGFGPCKKHRGKHVVASVVYYHSGARDIQDQRDRRKFSPTIVLIPPYDAIVDGKRHLTRSLTVNFYDGKYETCDPEEQYFLEEKRDIAWGETGKKMWEEIHLTAQQRTDIAKAELDSLNAQIAAAKVQQAKTQKSA